MLDLALSRPPSLGAGRLIAVDGPAGSGKTTLATAVADAAGAPLVHVDDLLDGWDGLPRAEASLVDLLAPLAEGATSTYRPYDWAAERFTGPEVTLSPAELIVVEGVGAGAPAIAPWTTLLVWVEAERSIRLARGLARDGEQLRPQWLEWQRCEDALHAAQRTRERADQHILT